MIFTIDIGKITATMMQSVAAVLTTCVSIFLLWAGTEVFANYGITLGIAFHSMTVLCVMAFALYLIYRVWSQVYMVAKGQPLE